MQSDNTGENWPNICDDKQDFAKYLWKKLPEIHDDKRNSTLNTAELLPSKEDINGLVENLPRREDMALDEPFGNRADSSPSPFVSWWLPGAVRAATVKDSLMTLTLPSNLLYSLYI